MKRVLVIAILVVVLVMSLCGCNENWSIGNYNWRHVHFSDAIGSHCATIESWHDNTTGIELHTKECGSMFLSEGSYILFENGAKCPFCNGD